MFGKLKPSPVIGAQYTFALCTVSLKFFFTLRILEIAIYQEPSKTPAVTRETVLQKYIKLTSAGLGQP